MVTMSLDGSSLAPSVSPLSLAVLALFPASVHRFDLPGCVPGVSSPALPPWSGPAAGHAGMNPCQGVVGTCCGVKGCGASLSPHVLPLANLAHQQ